VCFDNSWLFGSTKIRQLSTWITASRSPTLELGIGAPAFLGGGSTPDLGKGVQQS
jgi:hypothetical protein